jgi:hypothetical protein
MEGLDIRHILGRPAPTGDLEAEACQHGRRVAAEFAETHDADADIVRHRLAQLAPDMRRLLARIGEVLAVVQQHLQRHPFGHAGGQIGIDDADDRHVRQRRIADDMVDTSTKREHGLEVRQIGEGLGRRPPGQHIVDGFRIGDVRPDRQRPLRLARERNGPGPWRPIAGSDQDAGQRGLDGHCETMPSGAVSIEKAAAIRARV